MQVDKFNFIKRTWAEININALKHNYNEIRKHTSKNAKLCCVVKADGYGHGAIEVAKTLSSLGADWFAVSNIEEALQLRKNDIKEPILILGYTPYDMTKTLSDYGISQAVYSKDYARALSDNAVQNNVSVKIHLKLDTGMSRLGLMCQSFDRDFSSLEEAKEICTMPNFITEGIFTHFAVSDETENGRNFTNGQFENFMYSIKHLENMGIKFKIRHCANSGAVIDYPNTHLDMVRAGIILYGLAPSVKLIGRLNLKPVMQLKSVVSQVKQIPTGATVSYGRTFQAEKNIKIATIPVGYADGYVRVLAKNAGVQVHDKRARLVGRVCMDQIMADVTHIKDISTGDEVILFGNGENGSPTANDIAAWSNTINYEVTCLVGKRVARVYLEDGEITSTTTLL